jgi:predicted GNAT family acetyltransferase
MAEPDPDPQGGGDPRVVDNADEHRYELWLGHVRAGVIEYTTRHDVVVLQHTEIDPAFEGRGLGSTLIAAAIRDIRERGLRLFPDCPFVQAYLERHPEERDISLPAPVPKTK